MTAAFDTLPAPPPRPDDPSPGVRRLRRTLEASIERADRNGVSAEAMAYELMVALAHITVAELSPLRVLCGLAEMIDMVEQFADGGER